MRRLIRAAVLALCCELAAVRQLRRYMDAYGCSRGYAVSPSLSVDLPDDMTFIRLE